MNIEAAQWNIGGGLILNPEQDPQKPESYNEPGLDYVVRQLKAIKPAILTLQGVGYDEQQGCQTSPIFQALGYNDVQVLPLGPSRYLEGVQDCIAVLSYFPLWIPDWETHEGSGVLTVKARINSRDRLMISNVFADPQTGLTPELIKALQLDPQQYPYHLIQGDFNLPPDQKDADLAEIAHTTDPIPMPHQRYLGNRNHDQVFIRGIKTIDVDISDYHPRIEPSQTWSRLIVSQFSIPNEPPARAPRTPSSARPILLHGDYPRPDMPHRNSSIQ